MGQETEPTRAAGEAAVEETLAYASAVEAAPPSISLQIGVTWRDTIDGVMQTGAKWDKVKVAWVTSGAVAPSVEKISRAAVQRGSIMPISTIGSRIRHNASP